MGNYDAVPQRHAFREYCNQSVVIDAILCSLTVWETVGRMLWNFGLTTINGTTVFHYFMTGFRALPSPVFICKGNVARSIATYMYIYTYMHVYILHIYSDTRLSVAL